MTESTDTIEATEQERPELLSLFVPLGHPAEAESASLLRERAMKRLSLAIQVAIDHEDGDGIVSQCVGTLIYDVRTLLHAASALEAGRKLTIDEEHWVSGESSKVLSGVLSTCEPEHLAGEDVAEIALGNAVAAAFTWETYSAMAFPKQSARTEVI